MSSHPAKGAFLRWFFGFIWRNGAYYYGEGAFNGDRIWVSLGKGLCCVMSLLLELFIWRTCLVKCAALFSKV